MSSKVAMQWTLMYAALAIGNIMWAFVIVVRAIDGRWKTRTRWNEELLDYKTKINSSWDECVKIMSQGVRDAKRS